MRPNTKFRVPEPIGDLIRPQRSPRPLKRTFRQSRSSQPTTQPATTYRQPAPPDVPTISTNPAPGRNPNAGPAKTKPFNKLLLEIDMI